MIRGSDWDMIRGSAICRPSQILCHLRKHSNIHTSKKQLLYNIHQYCFKTNVPTKNIHSETKRVSGHSKNHRPMIFRPPQVRLRLEDIKSLIQAWQPGNLIEITGGFL